MTATLVRRYEHQNPLVAGSQGNVQALASGDWMVGWGEAGYLSEVNPAGQVLFNAHLPPGWESYRTYALPWTGQPAEPPAVAVTRSSGSVARRSSVYASWNGATSVASWRVLAGSSPTRSDAGRAAARRRALRRRSRCRRQPRAAYVAVQALDAAGAVIGVSAVAKAVRLQPGLQSPARRDAVRAGRLRVRSGACARGRPPSRPCLGRGEVVGEAAGVRCGQACAAGAPQLLRGRRCSSCARSASSSALSPALLCSSSRPLCVR